MVEQRERIVQKDSRAVKNDGTVVQEEVRTTNARAGTKVTITNVTWYVYGFIAILLALRFILKLTGANSTNAFVNLVYSVSGIFSVPFDTIFGVTKASTGTISSVFEPSILVAIAVYALVAWGIVKLMSLNESDQNN